MDFGSGIGSRGFAAGARGFWLDPAIPDLASLCWVNFACIGNYLLPYRMIGGVLYGRPQWIF